MSCQPRCLCRRDHTMNALLPSPVRCHEINCAQLSSSKHFVGCLEFLEKMVLRPRLSPRGEAECLLET